MQPALKVTALRPVPEDAADIMGDFYWNKMFSIGAHHNLKNY